MAISFVNFVFKKKECTQSNFHRVSLCTLSFFKTKCLQNMPEKWLSLLQFLFQKKKSVYKLTSIELVCVHSHLKKNVSRIRLKNGYLFCNFVLKKKSVHKLTSIELVCVHSHFEKKMSPEYARKMAISFAIFV